MIVCSAWLVAVVLMKGPSMKELLSVVTRKGQITVPAELRKALNLKEGDKVAFVLEPDGAIRLTTPRYPTIASLRGAAGRLKKPLSWDKMVATAREDNLKGKYARKP